MKHATIPEAVAEKATAVRTTVARNLSVELRAQRWSQRAAATALGLTPRYVNSRAHGDVDMSASDLALFAEFLDIPVARFFDEHHGSDGNVTSINAKTAPTKKGGSRSVGLDSFDLPTSTVVSGHLAPVTPIRKAS